MINLKVYKNSIKLFNNILKENQSDIYTFSNPALSIVNEHSNNTRLLEEKFNENFLIIFLKFYLLKFPLLIAYFFLKKVFSKKKKIKRNYKTIIFTHLVDKKFLEKKLDYIYGNIFNNKNVLFVYINHLKSHSKNNISDKELYFLKKSFMLDSYDIKYKDLFKIFHNCLLERKKFIEKAKKNRHQTQYLIAANFAFSSSSIKNLINYYSIVDLLKTAKPKNLLTSYEGHAFEKLIFCASHEANPKIKRIGYQSTFLLKHQNSIFLNLKEKFMPDEFWLSGSIYYRSFKKNFKKKKIYIFGSIRKINVKRKKKLFIKKNVCLVIPEGFYRSTYELIKFCLDYSKKYSNLNFIVRIHPELNLDLLWKKYPDIKFYKNYNINISKNFDVRKDFEKSSFCIYRQTTLVSQAIMYSVKPFYLKDKKNINVDSLYSLKLWKESVSSTSELMKKVKKFEYNKQNILILKKAKKLCNKFYTNINYKLLKNLN